MFRRIPGTKDILPQEAYWWQKIEEISRNIFSIYNYREIRPPLIEQEALFNRSLGDSSEIVQKQMFLIKKEKENYALRPEGTATLVRAYLENNLDKTEGFSKLYYIGPMFRAERPQKGRFRQFHHIGCEAIGSGDLSLDIEIISLMDTLLKAYSIKDYSIQLNTLGCARDKKELVRALQKSVAPQIHHFCPECRLRFKKNILRILDCKKESCRALIKKFNIGHNHLCDQCKAAFEQVKAGLEVLGVGYQFNPYLVRGLDYYTSTVFEITHPQLGSQDALGAGGRYDNLVAELGGPQAGAIGFAFGVERLHLVQSTEYRVENQGLVFLIALGEEAKRRIIWLLNDLRRSQITAEADYENKSLKGAMRKANDLGAKFVLLLGENELKKNMVTFKNMDSGEQKEIKQEEIVNYLTVMLHMVR